MYAYGLSEASCELIASYLKDRYHRVMIWTDRWMNQAYCRLSTTHGHITDCKLLVCKIWIERGGWTRLRKVTPQGSVMGPFAYNAHTNDLILVLVSICDIFNYADDNTVTCYGMSSAGVIEQTK